MKRIVHCFSVVLASALMSSCGIFNTEPFVDAHRDDEGNVVLEDTPRMWRRFVESVESPISREITGEKPEAGAKSWNEYWLRRIELQPSNRENRQKYVDYIIERRRQAGLPDLTQDVT